MILRWNLYSEDKASSVEVMVVKKLEIQAWLKGT